MHISSPFQGYGRTGQLIANLASPAAESAMIASIVQLVPMPATGVGDEDR